jgi:molybdopterin synthase catalytic subunit
VRISLTASAIDPARAFRELAVEGAGGIAVFVGRVRPDRVRRNVVRALEYEADRTMALRAMEDLARKVERSPGVRKVVLWHRVGTLPVGAVAVVVGAAAGHRAEAFRAARQLIERVKRDVPIWKSDRVRPARRPRRRPRPRVARSSGSGRAPKARGPR